MRDQDVGFKKWKCLSNGSKAILTYQKLKKEAQIHMPVFAHSCRNVTDDGFVHRAQDELSASSYHTSLSRCSPGDLGMRDACVGFLLLHQEAGRIRGLFIVFIMITVCGRNKVESRELSTSVPRILILLSSRLVYSLDS